MANNGHREGQYYPSDPRTRQSAGTDGRVRGFGMGQGTAGGVGDYDCTATGQPYPYQGQAPYGAQGYTHGQPGHQGQPGQLGHQSQSGQPGQPGQLGHQGHQGQAAYQTGVSQSDPYGQYGQYGQPGSGMPGRLQPSYPQPTYVAPATSQPVQVKPKRGKKVAVIIAIIVALICIALAATLFFLQPGGNTRAGTKGQLEGKTDAEIQAELNRQVEEGMFNISIASVVEFADGTSEGELRIENVPGNLYLMTVNITRDDTGQTVYTSDMLEPDYHIQRDTLDVDLDPGTYPCTATFTAYDPSTEIEIGQAAAKITLQVKG